MKTILLISPYWKESHRWMVSSYKLAALWQRMGYRVVVVCMGERTNEEHPSPTLSIYRVKDVFLPDPLNYGIAPTFPLHVLKALRAEQPEIVVVNKVLFWSSLVVPLLRLMGKKPIVLTDALVGMTWWPRRMLPKIIMGVGAWTVGWLVLLSAKRVVFFHPQPSKLINILGIAKKSEVIPTGIDVERHCNDAANEHRKPAFERTHHHNTQDIVVTYIGRLESVKGVDDFLAAAVPLKAKHSNLHIQVVGWYKEGHPLIAQYGDVVEFTGLRDDVPILLVKSDIFVLPSYSEGLSNALMEAMASSCACIATEVGGNRFLIENGISGLLYPPGDRALLARHIERLIEDSAKRTSLGEAAYQRIKTQFDWSVIERKYATLLSRV